MAGSGRAVVRYAVMCAKHGSELKGKGWKGMYVPPPANRSAAKTAGCAQCKAERTTT